MSCLHDWWFSAAQLDQIVQWGLAEAPKEVCGILFQNQVSRLPNHAAEDGEYEVLGIDIVAAVKVMCGSSRDEVDPSEITIWHTHPSGMVGPSAGDLENKNELFRFVVISLPNGEAVEF